MRLFVIIALNKTMRLGNLVGYLIASAMCPLSSLQEYVMLSSLVHSLLLKDLPTFCNVTRSTFNQLVWHIFTACAFKCFYHFKNAVTITGTKVVDVQTSFTADFFLVQQRGHLIDPLRECNHEHQYHLWLGSHCRRQIETRDDQPLLEK